MNTRRRDSTLTWGWAKADKIIFTGSVSSLSGASGSEEDSPDWAEIGVTFSLPVARFLYLSREVLNVRRGTQFEEFASAHMMTS